MAKQLVFSEDARRKLKAGVDTVANAVSTTLINALFWCIFLDLGCSFRRPFQKFGIAFIELRTGHKLYHPLGYLAQQSWSLEKPYGEPFCNSQGRVWIALQRSFFLLPSSSALSWGMKKTHQVGS